jgi:hypothetical protein
VKRILVAIAVAVFGFGLLTGCGTQEADTVSENLSVEADNFKVQRKIIFFNGITDRDLLIIEGKCSLGNYDSPSRLSVTCKTGPDQYKKHFLGLSDNVSFFVEQTESKNVSAYHYKVTVRPEVLIPDIDVRTSKEGDN